MSRADERDDRIVRVEHECGRRVELGDGIADALRELVDLEIPIELIAEEIRDHDDARLDPTEHSGE